MKCFFKIMALGVAIFGISHSFAQKRYKQRNHKLQINANLNLLQDGDIFGEGNLVQINYARNFKVAEVGVIAGFKPEEGASFIDIPSLGLHVGLLGEFNFLPNKRRVNWVPAFGLKVILYQDNAPEFYVNPYLVSKHFISTRTSINVELEYPIFLLEGVEFITDRFWNGIQLRVGYAYYFH